MHYTILYTIILYMRGSQLFMGRICATSLQDNKCSNKIVHRESEHSGDWRHALMNL